VAAFRSAAEKVVTMDNPEGLLFRPMKLVNIKKEVIKSLATHEFAAGNVSQKPCGADMQQLLDNFPTLKTKLSERLIGYVQDNPTESVIPKNILRDSDRAILQKISNPVPEVVIPMLLDLADREPAKFATLAQESLLLPVMTAMGYPMSQAKEFLSKLNSVRGVFKLA
jgi:hypothetical protein